MLFLYVVKQLKTSSIVKLSQQVVFSGLVDVQCDQICQNFVTLACYKVCGQLFLG